MSSHPPLPQWDAYVSGCLDPRDEQALELHAATCAECGQHLQKQARQELAVAEWVSCRQRSGSRWKRSASVTAAAAAAMFGVMVLGHLPSPERSVPELPGPVVIQRGLMPDEAQAIVPVLSRGGFEGMVNGHPIQPQLTDPSWDPATARGGRP